MTQKKDKQKVLGESFDDERIKTFLNANAYANLPKDYCLLEHAYRGMKADNFERFVGFFVEAGHDLNTRNQQGQSFLQVVEQHRLSDDYAQALRNAGAQ